MVAMKTWRFEEQSSWLLLQSISIVSPDSSSAMGVWGSAFLVRQIGDVSNAFLVNQQLIRFLFLLDI